MTKAKILPFTQNELKEYFDYNPLTGDLIRIKARKSQYVNTKCENFDKDGYNIVTLKGKRMKVHRLIMLYMNGSNFNQSLAIDHIDGNPSNNKYDNLRIVTESENSKNLRRSTRNRSGVTGVCLYNNKWKVGIGYNSSRIHLGYFNDFFEAVCARKSAEIKYGYHENHGR